ncbi:MAG TPA: hydroxymethylbilane synthase [Caulobacteraceae bacterium]|nr:hydroxymethylbilane synthase [Caulobacteraceae bacterium]
MRLVAEARMDPIRIGTRGSKLALVQARQVQAALTPALGAEPGEAERVAPIVVITTTGDRVQDRRLTPLGGKAMFTKEIEEALAARRIDCAVHSLKDVGIARQPGLVLAATPAREDARDAFISPRHATLGELPRGARLGTGASLRRSAQALHRRPDLEIILVRGNVDTRLAKLDAGEADATVLALAGLKRLGLQARIREVLDPLEFPPAPGQGAIVIETRTGDAAANWVRALDDRDTAVCVAAERGALEALEGSCHTAIGAHARLDGDQMSLVVEALTPDGAERFRRMASVRVAGDAAAAARELGLELGGEICAEGGERLFAPEA